MDDENKLFEARQAYHEAFSTEGPYPFGVSDADLTAALIAAVAAGQPVPADFDWYADVPRDAVV